MPDEQNTAILREMGATPQNPEPTDPLIGQVVNERFRVVSLIARGGMGRVYRAEQGALGRPVALKVLDPKHGGGGQPEFHKRFFLEASTCSKLTHPNTITVFDYGQSGDGVYYIAMELLEGRTLHRAIRDAGGPLGIERSLHITRQICRSLREAHAHELIHRDLKPANVFLMRHGDEDDFVKVLDFGLVKELDDGAEDLTQTGIFMGSPKYMSPEQIQGEAIDYRSDVYSTGVVLYEMLTGVPPFVRANSVNVLMAHVHDSPKAPSAAAPTAGLSAHVDEVVLKALSKKPEDRYQSMNELLRALKGLAREAGVPVTASMEQSAEQSAEQGAPQFAERLRTQEPAQSTIETVPERPAVKAAAAAPAQNRRSGRPAWAVLLMASAVLAGLALAAGLFGYVRSRESTPASVQAPTPANRHELANPQTGAQPENEERGAGAEENANAPESASTETVEAAPQEEASGAEAPLMSTVTFLSQPPGAAVEIDGERIGETPFAVELARGTEGSTEERHVVFRLSGHRSREVVFTLDEENERVAARLRPRRSHVEGYKIDPY